MPRPSALLPAGQPTSPIRWRRLCEDLQGRIRSGELADGARLPSEHALCRSHGLSRITVRRALHELETLGLIRRRQGASSEVVRPQRAVTSRLVHVLMAAEGHVMADLHQALTHQFSLRDLSHCTWTPEMLDRTGGLDQVAAMPARGVITIPFNTDPTRYLQEAARLGRTVMIGVEAGTIPESLGIRLDFAAPCRELLQRAGRAGIRSVLHITFRWPIRHRDGLAQILTAACLESGQRLTTLAVYHLGDEQELADIRTAVAAIERPALVLCAADFLAVAVRQAFAGEGSLPADLILAGLFNTPWSQAGSFTSIACRLDDLAERAVDLLLAAEPPSGLQVLPGELILRDSRLMAGA